MRGGILVATYHTLARLCTATDCADDANDAAATVREEQGKPQVSKKQVCCLPTHTTIFCPVIRMVHDTACMLLIVSSKSDNYVHVLWMHAAFFIWNPARVQLQPSAAGVGTSKHILRSGRSVMFYLV